jgi:hypothetical protein
VLHEEMEVHLALRSRLVGGGFKPPAAALAEDRRGERAGKGAVNASGGDRGDGAQLSRVVWESLLTRRNCEVTSKPGLGISGSG